MTPEVLTPSDLHEVREALADTTGAIHIRGAGTADDWAGAADEAPLVLDTTRLTGVLTHHPADMTVSVRAGTPLRDLAAELARSGQRLAVDPARIDRGATVGGLLATADSGPLAHTYGSLRDLVIGATLVLADGTVARSGGHVIKNVAGYDLTKLLHGSYGTFGVLVDVVLRLHPLPQATCTVRRDCTVDEAADHAREILASTLEPVCLEWADNMLLVRMEGTTEGLAQRGRDLADLIGGEQLDPDAADAAWARHAELVADAVVRVGCRPSRLPALVRPYDTGVAGLGTGIGTLTVPPDRIAELHTAVAEQGGVSVTRQRPPHGVPAWGQVPSAIRTLRALKNELDPNRRLCPGRFEEWFGSEHGQSAKEATP